MIKSTPASIRLIDLFTYALILATIVFGKQFTTYHLIGPIFLHDAILAVGAAFTLAGTRNKFQYPPLVAMWAISGLYFVFSLIFRNVPIGIFLRQYAVFGYLFCFYLLCQKSESRQRLSNHIAFLWVVAVLSMLLQSVEIVKHFVGNTNPFENYNYFSPAVIIGLLIAASVGLCYIKKWYAKMIYMIWVIILSMSTGHTSAFFGVIVVCITYIFMSVDRKSKLLAAGVSVIFTFGLILFISQFNDANAQWRLIVWKDIVYNIFVSNYGLFGNGFGIPYFDSNLIFELYSRTGSVGLFNVGSEEAYINPPHNSFLTIAYSIGFIPSLLMLVPFYKGLSKSTLTKLDGNQQFLFLSLIGATVWASFNVVLELPHSSGLYWFVYFLSWNLISLNTPDDIIS